MITITTKNANRLYQIATSECVVLGISFTQGKILLAFHIVSRMDEANKERDMRI